MRILLLLLIPYILLGQRVRGIDLTDSAKDTVDVRAKSVVSDSLNVSTADDTIALKLKSLSEGRICYLKQLSSANSNGGGYFVTRSASFCETVLGDSTVDGKIIVSHPTAGKRWVRESVIRQRTISFLDMGAIRDSSASASTEIQAALDLASTLNCEVYGDEGYYLLTDSLHFPPDVKMSNHRGCWFIVKSNIRGIVVDDRNTISTYAFNVITDDYTKPLISFEQTTGRHNDCIIENGIIWGPYYTPGFTPTQISFDGNGGRGIEIEMTVAGGYAFYNKFLKNAIFGFDYPIYMGENTTGAGANANIFSDNSMKVYEKWIYLGDDADYNHLDNCSMQPTVLDGDSCLGAYRIFGDNNNLDISVADVGNIKSTTVDSAFYFANSASANKTANNWQLYENYYLDDGQNTDISGRFYYADLEINDASHYKGKHSLDSAGVVQLPAGSWGDGVVIIYPDYIRATFTYKVDGSTFLVDTTNSGDLFSTSSTGGKFAIYDQGVNTALKNNLGDGRVILLRYDYNTP